MAKEIELRAEVCAPASLTFRLLAELLRRTPDRAAGLVRLGVGRRGTSRWEARLGARRLSWVQRDSFDRHGRRALLRLVAAGDGAGPVMLEGEWSVEELTECSSALTARLRAAFEPEGSGALAPFLGLLRANLELLLGEVCRLLGEGDA